MEQPKRPPTSHYTVFGIPVDGDAAYPQLIKLAVVICAFGGFALSYELSICNQSIRKSLLLTIEHLANAVPLSICTIIFADLFWRLIVNIGKWIDDKFMERRERRNVERENKMNNLIDAKINERIEEIRRKAEETFYVKGKIDGYNEAKTENNKGAR